MSTGSACGIGGRFFKREVEYRHPPCEEIYDRKMGIGVITDTETCSGIGTGTPSGIGAHLSIQQILAPPHTSLYFIV